MEDFFPPTDVVSSRKGVTVSLTRLIFAALFLLLGLCMLKRNELNECATIQTSINNIVQS